MFIKLGSECCFTEFSPTFNLPHPSFWQTGSQRLDDNSFFSTIFLQQTFNWIQRLAEALESAFVEAAVLSGICVVAGGNHGSNHPQCRCVNVSSFTLKRHLLSMASHCHWKPPKAKSSQKQIWTFKPRSCYKGMRTPANLLYFMLQLYMKIYFCLGFYLLGLKKKHVLFSSLLFFRVYYYLYCVILHCNS